MGLLDVGGLLRRLRVVAEPPSADALARLHRAFVARVPYENSEIQLGRPTSVDPAETAARVVDRGRGGYCFHLNGALSALLRELGYRVTEHAGHVQGRAGEPPELNRSHLALIVSGLPSPDSPDGRWLVDVGIGDGLRDPLPLRAGEHRQEVFGFGLAGSPLVEGWRLTHDPRGSFHAVDVESEPTTTGTFAARHHHLSTSPDSPFVRAFTAQRVDATGIDLLRALTLTRRAADGDRALVLESRGEWAAALADVFGLVFDAAELDVLWPKALAQHEARLAARAAAPVLR